MSKPRKKTAARPVETIATTVKLPEDTRARARAAAADAGLTMHAFLLTAVEGAVDQSEKRRAFFVEADAAEERLLRTGKGIPHAAVVAYFKARAEGKNPPRPKAVKWRK